MKPFTENTAGIWYDLAEEPYHQAAGLSNSMLKHLDRSPAHLAEYLKAKRAPTKECTFGRVVHHLVLTPAATPFWVTAPAGLDLRRKEGKAWLEAQPEAAEILTHAEGANATGAAAAVRRHETAAQALAQGQPEVSLFVPWSYGGTVLRKGRIDFVNDGPALVDLKTCADARPEAFARNLCLESQGGYGYCRQAAYYLDLWNDLFPDHRKDFFVFIAVEKVPPFGLGVYNVNRAALAKGRQEWMRLAALYLECQSADRWPGYDAKVQTLNLPKWALRALDEGTWFAQRDG